MRQPWITLELLQVLQSSLHLIDSACLVKIPQAFFCGCANFFQVFRTDPGTTEADSDLHSDPDLESQRDSGPDLDRGEIGPDLEFLMLIKLVKMCDKCCL